MEALESIHLLTFHLNRTKTFKVGGDYAIATMSVWCDELCQASFTSAPFRKSRRMFLEYHERLPKTLFHVIRRSKLMPGNQWIAMLGNAGDAVATLLGAYVLGKFPLLPEVADVSDPPASMERYRASLTICAGQIKEALSAIDAFGLHLEKSLINASPAKPGDASTDEADTARILVWGKKLCSSNPFSLSRRKAAKEYRAYRKETGAIGVRDAERFERMAPAVNTALQHLRHLLADLEQAITLSDSIQSLIRQAPLNRV